MYLLKDDVELSLFPKKLTFVLDPGLEFALLELKSGPLVFKSTGMPKESTVRDEERLEKIMSNFKWSIL